MRTLIYEIPVSKQNTRQDKAIFLTRAVLDAVFQLTVTSHFTSSSDAYLSMTHHPSDGDAGDEIDE